MNYLYSLLLGILQGLTEFLPVSSSGHLILARIVMKFEAIDGLTFDVAMHMGTLAALLLYFHRDIRSLIDGFVRSLSASQRRGDYEERLSWYIIAASVPAACIGFFFEAQIEEYFRNPSVIVVTLSVVAVLFLVFERVCKQTDDMQSMTLGKCLVVGIAQSAALIPGVSRSGITILAGLSQGLKRDVAARFSFLLSVPVMVGAGAKKALDLRHIEFTGDEAGILVVGFLSSAIVGWLAIKFLLSYLARHRLDVFAYYRLLLAVVVLVVIVSR
ncbi:MAG: undecaprenyl-diphosphatase UppP [Candidatus Latescibacterota bacterium]